MISFRLPATEEIFLKNYAKENSLNLSAFIKKAIFEKIEDMEDYKIAEKIAKDVNNGKEKTINLNDFLNEMDKNV